MTRGQTASPAPGESLREWRIDRLRAAGLDGELARRVAGDGRCDLHELLELVDRGCQPDLAARILAPLDDWRGR